MNSVLKQFFLVLISVTLLAYGCVPNSETEDFDNFKLGYDYFPLELGKYWIYQVDSTIYDDEGAKIIQTSAQLKEEIVEVYQDLTGDTLYRIERFWRADISSQWAVTDVWVAQKDLDRAYRTEENLKFIKFVFPPKEGKTWDGNIYFDNNVTVFIAGESLNMFAGWEDYRFTRVDEKETIGNIAYDHVATVLLTDDEEGNNIERRYALEKYARGVGLVYKDYIILDSQCTTCETSWEEKAEKGFILKQTLLEHN